MLADLAKMMFGNSPLSKDKRENGRKKTWNGWRKMASKQLFDGLYNFMQQMAAFSEYRRLHNEQTGSTGYGEWEGCFCREFSKLETEAPYQAFCEWFGSFAIGQADFEWVIFQTTDHTSTEFIFIDIKDLDSVYITAQQQTGRVLPNAVIDQITLAERPRVASVRQNRKTNCGGVAPSKDREVEDIIRSSNDFSPSFLNSKLPDPFWKFFEPNKNHVSLYHFMYMEAFKHQSPSKNDAENHVFKGVVNKYILKDLFFNKSQFDALRVFKDEYVKNMRAERSHEGIHYSINEVMDDVYKTPNRHFKINSTREEENARDDNFWDSFPDSDEESNLIAPVESRGTVFSNTRQSLFLTGVTPKMIDLLFEIRKKYNDLVFDNIEKCPGVVELFAYVSDEMCEEYSWLCPLDVSNQRRIKSRRPPTFAEKLDGLKEAPKPLLERTSERRPKAAEGQPSPPPSNRKVQQRKKRRRVREEKIADSASESE